MSGLEHFWATENKLGFYFLLLFEIKHLISTDLSTVYLFIF